MRQESISKLKEILTANGFLGRDLLDISKILLTTEILLKKNLLQERKNTDFNEDLKYVLKPELTKHLGGYFKREDHVLDTCYRQFKNYLDLYDYVYEENENVVNAITKQNYFGLYSFCENTITEVITDWILETSKELKSAYLPYNQLITADEKIAVFLSQQSSHNSMQIYAPFVNYDNELVKLLYLILKDRVEGYIPYESTFEKETLNRDISYDCGFSCPPLACNFSVDDIRHSSDVAIARDMYKKVSGRFCTIVRSSFSSSISKEMRQEREEYIKSERLYAVVLLPSGFLIGSGVTTLALIFDKEWSVHDSIMMVDLSKPECFEKGKTGRQMVVLNKLAKETLCNALQGKESDIAKKISVEQIISNKFNLSPSSYLLKIVDRLSLFGERNTKLSDIATIYRAQASNKANTGTEYYEIGVADINRLGIVEKPKKVVKIADEQEKPKNIVHKGDILLAIKGAVGKVGFLDKEYDNCIAGQSFVIIRSKDYQWSGEFIFWQLNSKTITEYLKGVAEGAIIPLLKMNVVRELKLIAPTEKTKALVDKVQQEKYKIFAQMNRLNYKLEELETLA